MITIRQMTVQVLIYLNHELIRMEILPLDAIVIAPLLGIEISKNAQCPTELRVEVRKVEESRVETSTTVVE